MSEVVQGMWGGEGTVGFAGRSALLGLSHMQGRAPDVTTGH